MGSWRTPNGEFLVFPRARAVPTMETSVPERKESAVGKRRLRHGLAMAAVAIAGAAALAGLLYLLMVLGVTIYLGGFEL